MDSYSVGLAMGGALGGLMLSTYLWAAIYFVHIRGEDSRERVYGKVLLILSIAFTVFIGIAMVIGF